MAHANQAQDAKPYSTMLLCCGVAQAVYSNFVACFWYEPPALCSKQLLSPAL